MAKSTSASDQRGSKKTVNVAIIGGGCAGLATAWELTRPDVERECKYNVTVYERSWRLGGKAASGRDEVGRIREHGIHIWLGFYENAFRMMRECYAEVAKHGWGPQSKNPDEVLPHRTFDDAFFVEPHVGVASPTGGCTVWTGFLPPTDGLPGTDIDEDSNPFTVSAYLGRALALTKALIHSVLGRACDDPKPGGPRSDTRSTLDEAIDTNLDFSFDVRESPKVLVERIATLLRTGVLTSAAGLLQAVTIIETVVQQMDPAPQFSESVLGFLEATATETRKQLRDLVAVDESTQRKTEIIDLIMTIAVGLFRDRVLLDPRGLDALNDIDCKQWLLRHGAVASAVDSPFVTGLYDLAFCYERGDRKRPALAAGQALRGALRMFFSYRGSPFWRMRSGMGETVFSPLFRVLTKRGVTFRFLHSLKNISFEKRDGWRIDTLSFDRSRAVGGFSDRQPLDHFGCWRHERPKTDETSEIVLRDGDDFDAVVVAIGIDDFKAACTDKNFLKNNPRWAEMFDRVKTIGTQAAQVWMTKSLTELGWRRDSALVSALEGPFETWADMTHTLAAERNWRQHPNSPQAAKTYGDDVKSIAYFCGVLPDRAIDQAAAKYGPGDVQYELEHGAHGIEEDLRKLLISRVQVLWPDAHDPLDALAKEDGTAGGNLSDQHIQANFSGSDRYTLALPGTLAYRISPLDYTVVNMTTAGDWTECGFNEGCVEAAVMSGMLAAHAISGEPDLNQIIGYNHP